SSRASRRPTRSSSRPTRWSRPRSRPVRSEGRAIPPSPRSMLLRVGMSDGQLVARCRTGDPAAWNELVERFSRYVYAICVQAFRLPEHDAEDVFQDVFAKVYEHLGRLRDDEAIRPWIGQLTRRTCIDRLRAARETPTEEVEPPGADETL